MRDPLGSPILLRKILLILPAGSGLGFLSLSPDQLAWGFLYGCPKTSQNLDFRNPVRETASIGVAEHGVFQKGLPSFVSLVGKEYERPSIVFLLHDETLTAASFEPGTTVPDAMYLLPVDASNSEEFGAQGKLLSHFGLAHFDNIQDVLSAGGGFQNQQRVLQVRKRTVDSDNPELIEPVVISAEELWSSLTRRPSDFKVQERKEESMPLSVGWVSWGRWPPWPCSSLFSFSFK